MTIDREHHNKKIKDHGIKVKNALDSTFIPKTRAYYNSLMAYYHGMMVNISYAIESYSDDSYLINSKRQGE